MRKARSPRKLALMRDASMRIGGALLGVLVFGGLALQPTQPRAQEHTFLQGSAGPTIDDYVKQAGTEVEITTRVATQVFVRVAKILSKEALNPRATKSPPPVPLETLAQTPHQQISGFPIELVGHSL